MFALNKFRSYNKFNNFGSATLAPKGVQLNIMNVNYNPTSTRNFL